MIEKVIGFLVEATVEESVLVIEDSKVLALRLTQALEQEFGIIPVFADSLNEAKKILSSHQGKFFAAVVDLNLPDCGDTDAVILTLSYRIPTIVLTGSNDRIARNKVLKMKILDFLIKGGRVVEQLIAILKRVRKHKDVQVLIVDDAKTSRALVRKLLERSRYQVLEAASGIEALECLSNNPRVKLVITDFHMPGMDGFELISQIRQFARQEEMAIIGLSSSDADELTSYFLKMGANDFLYKGFSNEEFYCRVRLNIELVERFEEIKDASNRDYLTNLYNRRYLFKQGNEFLDLCNRADLPVAVALMDLDHFKKINDTYGHDAGDCVLREFGAFLQKNSRSTDLVARFGGEEFCFLACNMPANNVMLFFKRLCWGVSQMEVAIGELKIKFTVSIGVAMVGSSLHDAIKMADQFLYNAKAAGRNRVAFAPPSTPGASLVSDTLSIEASEN